jgi:hypothetical protein
MVVQLRLGTRLRSRGALHDARDRPAERLGSLLQQQPVAGTLTTGQTRRFAFTVDLGPLGLSADLGVYPVQVIASGTVDGMTTRVGAVDSFLVHARSPITTPLPVSAVVPLTDRPRIGPHGVLTDDGLAPLLSADGRLGRILAAVAPVAGRSPPSVTLAVDGALLDDVQRMAGSSYQVATRGGGTLTRARNTSAVAFLANLRSFVEGGGTVIALPYADVDVVGLTRAGQLHIVRTALAAGSNSIRRVLGSAPVATVAYPPDGDVDQPTLDLLARLGVDTVVLSDNDLGRGPDLPYTPSAVTRLASKAGPVTVLVADGELSALASGRRGAASPALAHEQLLAETALIAAEAPSVSRPQVVALPRGWSPPTAAWARFVLSEPSQPWLRPTPLRQARASVPVYRGVLAYPVSAQLAELPIGYLREGGEVRADAAAFQTVLCPPPASDGTAAGGSAMRTAATGTATGSGNGSGTTRACGNTSLVSDIDGVLTRSASSAWRVDPGAGAALRTKAAADLNGLRSQIRVVASRVVTLTSRTGKVPVTLENNLGEMVTVRVELSAPDRSRLSSATTVERTIPARQRVQVEIEVKAQSAGTFPVQVALLTPQGRPLTPAPPLEILVRSTAYGVIAIAITGSAVTVLFLAVAIRGVRRLRAMRRRRSLRDAG